MLSEGNRKLLERYTHEGFDPDCALSTAELNILLSAARAEGSRAPGEFMAAAKALLVMAEEAEDQALVGDEGCVWPVERLRVTFAALRALFPAPVGGEVVEALKWISEQYENLALDHVDFRVQAKILADEALASLSPETTASEGTTDE
jgi:hypothetical protein